eukprot:5738119-Alexandrium_andersonii.AAC.1
MAHAGASPRLVYERCACVLGRARRAFWGARGVFRGCRSPRRGPPKSYRRLPLGARKRFLVNPKAVPRRTQVPLRGVRDFPSGFCRGSAVAPEMASW